MMLGSCFIWAHLPCGMNFAHRPGHYTPAELAVSPTPFGVNVMSCLTSIARWFYALVSQPDTNNIAPVRLRTGVHWRRCRGLVLTATDSSTHGCRYILSFPH